ncbi:hypothetical protein [Ruminococcus sp.]|uniref:hypothetical protein n=1 Tax=Ruminococcus sp. TaxID=41978 RepID=UPI0039924B9F
MPHVIAVVPAVVGELDQSPDKYLRAVSFPADAVRRLKQRPHPWHPFPAERRAPRPADRAAVPML